MGWMVPVNGSTRKSQSYGTTPGVVRRSAGRSSWIVKYSTGYATPGADPQTGPATRKAAPAGIGATMVDLPVTGSSTPTPWSATYPINPWVRAPVSGDGEVTATVPPPPPQADAAIMRAHPTIRFRRWALRT